MFQEKLLFIQKNLKMDLQKVKESVTKIAMTQVQLVKDVTNTAILMSSSLSGIAILVAPLSFNIPAAISVVLFVVDSITTIIERVMSILPFLEPLNLLKFLTNFNFPNPVLIFLNTALRIILGILKSITSIKRLIDLLLKALFKLIGGKDTCQKQSKKLNRKIRKKVRERNKALGLGRRDKLSNEEARKKSEELDEDSDERDDAEEAQDEIESYQENLRTVCNIKFPDEFSEDLLDGVEVSDPEEDVREILTKLKNVSSEIPNQVERFVYDAELPDGTVLSGLTEADLESLREKFNIILKTQDGLNQS